MEMIEKHLIHGHHHNRRRSNVFGDARFAFAQIQFSYGTATSHHVRPVASLSNLGAKESAQNSEILTPSPPLSALDKPPSPFVLADTTLISKNSKVFAPKRADVQSEDPSPLTTDVL